MTLLLLARRARRGLDLDRRAVRQLAHGAERPDDDLVAFLRARQYFEVLLAGDARLDRREHRLVVLDDEHALEFLALLPWLQLGVGRCRQALLSSRVLFLHHIAVLVDYLLPDRRRLD